MYHKGNNRVKFTIFIFLIMTIFISQSAHAGAGKNVSRHWRFAAKGAIIASPTIGDIDNDGKNEIVFCSSVEPYIYVINAELMPSYRDDMVKWQKKLGENTEFYELYKTDDTKVVYAYRYPTKAGFIASPILEDLAGDTPGDKGDGILDIIAVDKNGNLYILNFNKKKTHKIYASNMAVTATPALGNFTNDAYRDIVFGGKNGKLVVYNGHKGKVEQLINLGKTINMSPCLYDINKDNQLDIIIGSDDGKVKALNGKNIKTVLWTVTKPNSQIFSSASIFKLGKKECVLLAFNDYRFMAVDARSGKQLWSFTTTSYVTASPLVINSNQMENSNDDILIASNDIFYLINGKTGKPIWEKTAPKVVMTPIVYDLNQDGKLDVIYGGEIGTLSIISLSNGKKEAGFTFVTDQLQSIKSSPILADVDGDEVLDITVGCNDGYLYSFRNPFETIKVEKNLIIFESIKGEPSFRGRVDDVAKLRRGYSENLRRRMVAYLFKRADFWMKQGKVDEAAKDLEKVIELDKEKRFPIANTKLNQVKSQYIDTLIKDSNSFIKELNLDKLNETIKKIEKLGPEDTQLTKLLQIKDSVKDLEKKQKDAEDLLKQAKQEIAAHDILTAFKNLNNAEKLSPFNQNIKNTIKSIESFIKLYNEADLAVKNKKNKEALEKYLKVQKKYPNLPGIDAKIKKLKLKKNMIPGAIVLVVLIIAGIIGLKFSSAQKKKKLELQKQRRAAQRRKREEELGEGKGIEEPVGEPTLSGDLASFETETVLPVEEAEELETAEAPDTQLTMDDLQSVDTTEDDSQPTAPEPEKLEEGIIEHGTIPDAGSVDSIEDDWGLAPTGETQEDKDLEENVIDETPQEEVVEEESVSETAIEAPQESLEIESDLEFANIENRYNMAQKLVDDGEFEKAIEEYSKISEIESKFKLLSMAQIGICYLKKGDKIKAMDVIKKIPYNDANIDEEIRKELLLHLAHEFEKNNLLKSAIGMYKLAIPLTEVAEKKAILYKIGTLFDENGLTQEAITAYKELYLIDSQYRDVADRLDTLGI